MATLTEPQFHSLAPATELRISSRGTFDFRFQLKQLLAVQGKLDECEADLNREWNMTPEKIARIKTEAQSLLPLGRYFSDLDYPQQAMREHNTGTVGVRLMIDEAGAPTDCATAETSSSAVLDAMTCIVLRQRAKFKPAIDVDGKPAKSFRDQRVNWVIP